MKQKRMGWSKSQREWERSNEMMSHKVKMLGIKTPLNNNGLSFTPNLNHKCSTWNGDKVYTQFLSFSRSQKKWERDREKNNVALFLIIIFLFFYTCVLLLLWVFFRCVCLFVYELALWMRCCENSFSRDGVAGAFFKTNKNCSSENGI